MKDKWMIYKIVFPNGKHYIGLTKDLHNRISCHKRDLDKRVQRPVYNALHHFGWDSVKFEEVETDIPTIEEANELEKKYIQEYDSYIESKNGYNCTLGGDGRSGAKKTPEKIEEFRQWALDIWKDPSHRGRMQQVFDNRKNDYPPESREKMSKSAKKRIARDGHAWVGRKHSKESKEKMRGPRNKNSKGYLLKSLKNGKRIYCSSLDFVFFSLTDCAEYLGVSKSTVYSGLRNPNTRKYKSLSYYNSKRSK